MLYHLFVSPGPLQDVLPGTGVFRYISFRTAWGLITALGIAYVVFPAFIARMRARKVDQIIREDGPESHLLNKVGTPTMGGVCILAGVAIATLIWARLDVVAVWLTLVVLLGYGALGLVDDWKKVMERSSAGLAGRLKIAGQLVVGGIAIGVGLQSGALSASVGLPFVKGALLDIGVWLYVPFALLVLVGASNAVNLTDGLDGLAVGPVMTSSATYGVIAYVVGNARFSSYLGIPYVEGAGELTVVAASVIGAGLAFLWYNAYPASVFMGDVGSLALGGVLAAFALFTKHELLLALVGGIFVLEAVSVILQVGWFKATGDRIFKMAPIHHHYEKIGWSEPKIIVRFWIISVVLALVALSTLKLR